MGFVSILSYAHKLVSERVVPGEPVIDATVGNGVDTLFLSRLTGSSGEVFGFDIQAQALEKAKKRVLSEAEEIGRVHWIHSSHALMDEMTPDRIIGKTSAVMFNLGYLPGTDHATITLPQSTIPALEASLKLLRRGGIVTIVLYTGHEGGSTEAKAVEQWAADLSQKNYQVLKYEMFNQRNHPPYLIAVEKR